MKSLLFSLMSLWMAIGLAHGQYVTQQIPLTPGWNAVFFEVNPQPGDADSVFEGLPIESVWEWNRRGAPIQFIQDPNSLVPQLPEWSTWFPTTSAHRIVANLFDVPGGRGYLIKVSGSANVTLSLKGTPAAQSGQWATDSYSLAGFFVKPTGAPTFRTYFAQSTAHADTAQTPLSVLRMDATGKWVPISASTTTIQPGKAYWIRSRGASNYRGPAIVETEVSGALDFGLAAEESRFFLRNNSTTARTFTIQLLSSAAAPAGAAFEPVAGVPLLSFKDFARGTGTTQFTEWEPFPASMTVTLPAGDEKLIGIATRRGEHPEPVAGEVASYQGVLSVDDNFGLRYQLGVKVKNGGLQTPTPQVAARGIARSGGTPANRFAGLWVGSVNVGAVNWVGGVSPRIAALAEPAEIRQAALSLGYPEQFTQEIMQALLDYKNRLAARDANTLEDQSEKQLAEHFEYPNEIRVIYDQWVNMRANNTNPPPANPVPLRTKNTLLASRGEFPLRLIVHVSSTGTVHLLSRVTKVWQRGTTAPDPLNPGNVIIDTPGRFRLFSSNPSAAVYSGAKIAGGEPVPVRITSTGFTHRTPFLLMGTFGTGIVKCPELVEDETTTAFPLVITEIDPLNPFTHKFHPQHDGKDPRGNPLPAGNRDAENFRIERCIRMEFVADHPYGEKNPGWGQNEVGGVYYETISGLHKDPIKTGGIFTLKRVSSIADLD